MITGNVIYLARVILRHLVNIKRASYNKALVLRCEGKARSRAHLGQSHTPSSATSAAKGMDSGVRLRGVVSAERYMTSDE